MTISVGPIEKATRFVELETVVLLNMRLGENGINTISVVVIEVGRQRFGEGITNAFVDVPTDRGANTMSIGPINGTAGCF